MEIQRRGQNPKPDDVVVAIAMSTRQSIRTKSKTGGESYKYDYSNCVQWGVFIGVSDRWILNSFVQIP